MKKLERTVIAIGCVFAICLLVALSYDAQSSQALNQGSSPEVSQVEQESSSTSAPRQLPTGDFRLRSYLKESHPKFRARSSALARTTAGSSNCDPVVSGRIHRFIAGVDSCVTPMTEQEINQKLNDPFASAILRQGQFPDSVDAIVTAIANSGLGLQRQSYMVGEGSQIPTNVASREQPRNLRYAITWVRNQNDAQILLSAIPGGNSSFHQVISWDNQARKYNFYEFREQRGTTGGTTTKVWSWAGDSPLARTTEAMGKGCFDCHHNGIVIMKELQFPWNNWQSQLATISPLVVPFAVAQEELFKQLNGAQVFENVIRNGFQTYYRNWLRDHKSDAGTIRLSDVNEMLRHLTTNTTINFASTQIQSNGANTSPANADISGIPNDLFLWDSALNTVLNLDYTIPSITFQRRNYDDYLKNHNFKLVQSDFTKPDGTPLYEQNGSTYFSLFVPVPPAEDLFMLQQMRSNNILTDKFIAALLMVDFKNPVFSHKRCGLQQYAAQIASGTIVNRVSSVPNDFAEKVRAAAASQPPCDSAKLDNCTAEQEFLYTWDLPDNQWKVSVEKRIQAYLDNIKNLSPEDQLDQLMRLSVKRQAQFKSWSLIGNLNEFSLLIPYTDLSQQ